MILNFFPPTGIGGLIAQRLEEQLFRWLRAAELTCDRAALLVAQDPKVEETQTVNSHFRALTTLENLIHDIPFFPCSHKRWSFQY